MTDRNALRSALRMVPGGGLALGVGDASGARENRANRRPNSPQHAQNLQRQEDARTADVRRGRITRGLQAERQRNRQPPMSANELATALSEYGL